MNKIFQDTALKFNITQAQAETIYLSMFKFMKFKISEVDFLLPIEEREKLRTCFNIPNIGKIKLNNPKIEHCNKKYKEKHGKDCTYF